MAAITSSGDITPQESRPEENKRSHRAADYVEAQSVERTAVGVA